MRHLKRGGGAGGVPLEVDEIDKEVTGVLLGWLGWSQSEFTTS